jgi:hypothetical protein
MKSLVFAIMLVACAPDPKQYNCPDDKTEIQKWVLQCSNNNGLGYCYNMALQLFCTEIKKTK